LEGRRLIADFSEERDWTRFHNPKNLVMALAGEVGELAEFFQCLTPDESSAVSDRLNRLHTDASSEVADILIYLVRLAQVLDVDLSDAVRRKVVLNEQRYPVIGTYGKLRSTPSWFKALA
jgi:NTP pyrophosphatase (non-canonical NTP hydrolase)